MKLAIIISSIIYVVSKIISYLLGNYIANTTKEVISIKFGIPTKATVVLGLLTVFEKLSGGLFIILIVLVLIDKIL